MQSEQTLADTLLNSVQFTDCPEKLWDFVVSRAKPENAACDNLLRLSIHTVLRPQKGGFWYDRMHVMNNLMKCVRLATKHTVQHWTGLTYYNRSPIFIRYLSLIHTFHRALTQITSTPEIIQKLVQSGEDTLFNAMFTDISYMVQNGYHTLLTTPA